MPVRRYEQPPPFTLEPERTYAASLRLPRGEVTLRLLPDLAPQTVNSFVFLAEERYFDGCTFHRVVPGFIAQTGDPTNRGDGGPGYVLPDEVSPRPFVAGTVGMANPVPGVNGSQFFVTLEDARHLDGRFTAFAEVTAGLDLLRGLPARRGDDPAEPPGERVESLVILAD